MVYLSQIVIDGFLLSTIPRTPFFYYISMYIMVFFLDFSETVRIILYEQRFTSDGVSINQKSSTYYTAKNVQYYQQK